MSQTVQQPVLPDETERLAINGKKIHPPSKTDAVLEAAAERAWRIAARVLLPSNLESLRAGVSRPFPPEDPRP